VVAGLATAEICHRCGSIWSGLVVLVVFNLPSFLIMVFTSTG
jgi:hypothetical protein